MRIAATYQEVRERMRPGDVLAFSGKGNFSELIKWATRGPVSHVGMVLHAELKFPGKTWTRPYYNQVVESTSLGGFSGVAISRCSRRLAAYDGAVWWLPLSEEIRSRLNEQRLIEFVLDAEGKPYDVPQAIFSALDFGGPLTRNVEDFAAFFCSELLAGGLEAGRAVPPVNASEVTPLDLCSWAIYEADYYQLKGEPAKITAYNTRDPAGWTVG